MYLWRRLGLHLVLLTQYLSPHARDVMVVVVEVEVVELKPNRKYQQDHVTSEFERT